MTQYQLPLDSATLHRLFTGDGQVGRLVEAVVHHVLNAQVTEKLSENYVCVAGCLASRRSMRWDFAIESIASLDSTRYSTSLFSLRKWPNQAKVRSTTRAARQDREALLVRGALDALDGPAEVLTDPVHERPGVATIGPQGVGAAVPFVAFHDRRVAPRQQPSNK